MIKISKYAQLIRYVAAGGLAYTVELAVLFGLKNGFGLSRTLATAISFWVGLLAAFTLQKLAFNNRAKTRRLMGSQLSKYILLVVFNYCFTLAIVALFPERLLFVSRTFALALTTIWNYLLYQHVIFNDTFSFEGLYASLYACVNKQFKKAEIYFKQNETTILKVGVAISTVLLVTAGAYAAYNTTRTQVAAADEFANTYMVAEQFRPNGFSVLDIHTNLFKMPLLLVQSALGFSIGSFTTINIALVVTTNLLWVLLLMKILRDRKAVIVGTLALALVQVNAVLFNLNFIFKTFRNIEIPLIGLLLYWLFKNLHRLSLLRVSLFVLAYSLLLSGDAYYQYTISLPVLIVAGILWLQKKISTIQTGLLASIILACSIGAVVINRLIRLSGLFTVIFGYQGKSYLVNYDALFMQVRLSGREIFRLFGADFFGQALNRHLLVSLVCSVILFGALLGSVLIAKQKGFDTKKATLEVQALLLLAAYIPAVTYLVYIFSGQAKPDGSVARYLILLPIWGSLGFAVFISQTAKSFPRKGLEYLVMVVLVFGFLAGIPGARTHYAERRIVAAKEEAYYHQLDQTLSSTKTEAAITGHWSGTSLRFWSNNKNIKVAPIQNCDQPLAFLTNRAWYAPDESKRSALIIDRAVDGSFWNCSIEELYKIYGKPTKIVSIDNPRSTSSADAQTEVWFYNHDVRSSLDRSQYDQLPSKRSLLH